MRDRMKLRVAVAILLGCLFLTALLDDPGLYNPEPGPDAPMFYDFRNDRWVQP